MKDKTNHNKLQGKRYIGLARQSCDKDGVASTEGQTAYIRRECLAVGMKEIEIFALEGVTGSLPGRREDLHEILQRKRTDNDFDALAIHVVDRLTRGGAEHGFWFEYECTRLGIELFFVGENLPDGPYGPVVKAAMYGAAQEASIATGRRSAGGQSSAIASGMFLTAGQTPIGCDRLYFGCDHKPKYILHNLVDGRQEQLHPVTREVISTFGTVGKKSRNRFKKQRNEYSLLIPGDPQEQRTVRVIFYMRYIKGWRGARIAGLLNEHGRPAPKGGTWCQRQVECVYENEAYVGLDYKNRIYSGRFYARDKVQGYVALDRSKTELATAKHFRPVLKPRDQWVENEQPYMVDFLPRHVRAAALGELEQLWTLRLDPTRPRRPQTSHPASDYLLSNKLVAKQDGERLIGTLSGKSGKQIPYYRHRGARRKQMKGNVLNHLIPMQPLHDALLDVMNQVIVTLPDLRETLIAEVREHLHQMPSSDGSLVALEAERDELTDQIKTIIRCLKGAARKDSEGELTRLGARRNEIEAEITRIERSQTSTHVKSPEFIADALLADVGSIDLHRLAPHAVRHLIDLLVESATVDMETKAVSFKLSLPKHAFDAKNGLLSVCPTEHLRSSTGCQTHLPLVSADCVYHQIRGSRQAPCYVCQRRAA